jgi:hypothetical protein
LGLKGLQSAQIVPQGAGKMRPRRQNRADHGLAVARAWQVNRATIAMEYLLVALVLVLAAAGLWLDLTTPF